MLKSNHYYLIHIQYVGYRYHGWLLQDKYKSVQGMINKTLNFVLGHENFKTIGCSRTDAMVSANHMIFELFLSTEIEKESFLMEFNRNLPQDIRAIQINTTDKSFNIIQHPKVKEYIYLFAFGEKSHPFCAPYMTFIFDNLDIELMKAGASLFHGDHNFVNYIHKPTPNTRVNRHVITSKIMENNVFTANFFPKISYAYHIYGQGFGRYQVRLMMGQLIKLGKGEITLDHISNSLTKPNKEPLNYIAPPSGLILNKITLENFI